MGYSGYSQFFCPNYHYWTIDCNLLGYKDEKEKCPICNEEEVFQNMVNTTNGSFDDDGKRIDGFIKPKSIKKYKMECPNCHRHKICECSTYKIPKGRKIK